MNKVDDRENHTVIRSERFGGYFLQGKKEGRKEGGRKTRRERRREKGRQRGKEREREKLFYSGFYRDAAKSNMYILSTLSNYPANVTRTCSCDLQKCTTDVNTSGANAFD